MLAIRTTKIAPSSTRRATGGRSGAAIAVVATAAAPAPASATLRAPAISAIGVVSSIVVFVFVVIFVTDKIVGAFAFDVALELGGIGKSRQMERVRRSCQRVIPTVA